MVVASAWLCGAENSTGAQTTPQGSTKHTIFCGDFNLTPKSAEYAQTARAMAARLGVPAPTDGAAIRTTQRRPTEVFCAVCCGGRMTAPACGQVKDVQGSAADRPPSEWAPFVAAVH